VRRRLAGWPAGRPTSLHLALCKQLEGTTHQPVVCPHLACPGVPLCCLPIHTPAVDWVCEGQGAGAAG
jgi:hypothetical protein